MHESKSFDAGLARRGDHGDNTLGPPGKRRGVDTPPPRSARASAEGKPLAADSAP
ncbi:hypothetical protein J3L14_20720 [Burkholderia pseudomallei]|uniref:hypothetical protein n=1 Tax=Burkholderia pseudomallei TaxID=28450 RepID=UPI001A9F399A|nr:hypothetical protein [Burkholderia pseudomallei]QTB82942.1 hypothetical protein J3L14_20720 [Burkholderia pseudomallei]